MHVLDSPTKQIRKCVQSKLLMSQTECGVCDERHQATHYCPTCQVYLCALFADLHAKQKLTKSHVIKTAVDVNLPSKVNEQIEDALCKLDSARVDLMRHYNDALPPRGVIEANSPQTVRFLRDLFRVMIESGHIINDMDQDLRARKQSLRGVVDTDTLLKTLFDPQLFMVDAPITFFQHAVDSLKPAAPLRGWGSLGVGPGEFSSPSGLATHKSEVYVCDSSVYRIQVFKPDGHFLRMWDVPKTGHNTPPVAMAISQFGEVFVAKQNPPHVHVFTPDGCLVRTWSFAEADPANKFPVGIATTAGGEVVIMCKRIRVVDANGFFYRDWEVPEVPTGICVTPDGRVFVVSKTTCYVFGLDGSFRYSWPGLHDAKGVAVSGGLVYVAEENGARAFHLKGAFVRHCDSPTSASAVATDDTHVFIADPKKHAILTVRQW